MATSAVGPLLTSALSVAHALLYDFVGRHVLKYLVGPHEIDRFCQRATSAYLSEES
jgi:hypothetical protein